MDGIRNAVVRIAKVMDIVGGVVLTFMMLITVMDVILRYLGKPITGTYELVYLGGAVVIAFAMPRTSWDGGNVNVDFVMVALPTGIRKVTLAATRILGIAFFVLLGWNLFRLGNTLLDKHEVSLTLHVPIYPVVYALGVCAFVECLVLLALLFSEMAEVNHE
jgi:TRAP-type C4-dicarboxylate transport system permease small subunit